MYTHMMYIHIHIEIDRSIDSRYIYIERERERQTDSILTPGVSVLIYTCTLFLRLDHIRCGLIAKRVSGETPGGLFT